MISIFTTTIGRELYLRRQVESLIKLGGNVEYEHHILFQKYMPSNEFVEFAAKYSYVYHFQPEIINIGTALKNITSLLKGDLVIKLDDDAQVRSDNFLNSIELISQLIPGAVFSPYPVGLINNPGGVPSKDHRVKYCKENDTYYTFRKVNHIGGFARVSPKQFLEQIRLSNSGHTEDVEFSNFCRAKNIDMFYLENGLIVEHQESTLGQHSRYGDEYWKGRF